MFTRNLIAPFLTTLAMYGMICLGPAHVRADLIPSAPCETTSAPTSGAADAAGIQSGLKDLGLSVEQAGSRLAALTPEDMDFLQGNLDQVCVAGIPGFFFAATLIAVAVLIVLLFLLESKTQKRFN